MENDPNISVHSLNLKCNWIRECFHRLLVDKFDTIKSVSEMNQRNEHIQQVFLQHFRYSFFSSIIFGFSSILFNVKFVANDFD